MNIFTAVGIIIAMFFAPFMTVGCIMYHYEHTTLGIILIIIGVFNMIGKMLSE